MRYFSKEMVERELNGPGSVVVDGGSVGGGSRRLD